ncbi:mechanosensitive ion channel family protein [Alsobacter sp. R-9]
MGRIGRALRLLVVTAGLLGGVVATTGPAAPATDPPPGMTQDQFDRVVAAVAEALSKTLVPAPAHPESTSEDGEDAVDVVAERVGELVKRTPSVIAAVPDLPAQTGRVLDRLGRGPDGPNGTFLPLLALCAAAAVAAGFLVRATATPLRRRLSSGPGIASPRAVALLALLEGAALLAAWLVTRVALGSVLPASGARGAFAHTVLDTVVLAMAANCVFEIWLRPSHPAARLAPVGDMDAKQLKRWLVTAVSVVAVTRGWLSLMAMPITISATLFINALVVTSAYAAVVGFGSRGLGRWLAGLRRPDPDDTLVRRATTLLHAVAWPLIGIILMLRLYAALSGRGSVPLGTIATVSSIIVLLLSETLLRWVLRHPQLPSEGIALPVRIARSVARIARVIVGLAVLLVLARVWCVDALGLYTEAEWRPLGRTLLHAAMAGMAAFLLWEGVRAATDPYVAARTGTPEDAEDGPGDTAGSRARTLAPLLRVAALVLVVTVGTLAVLAMLGVNITPLVAGASIVGLAISFGSQTLVRDIVSGIFYLAEDAFRVGEYIDCGKAKGTVEGFALRSLKLRHQNGQLHTIPFGQLGQVTNFSRDWSTVKFNLRFARDTDLEALRKATKKIGIALMEDPEYAPDFIQPLKMQGVFEILDEALVARFKFTVKPIRPSLIQREAVKRLLRDLPAAGIRFPEPLVSVLARGSDDHRAVAETVAASAAATAAKVPAAE